MGKWQHYQALLQEQPRHCRIGSQGAATPRVWKKSRACRAGLQRVVVKASSPSAMQHVAKAVKRCNVHTWTPTRRDCYARQRAFPTPPSAVVGQRRPGEQGRRLEFIRLAQVYDVKGSSHIGLKQAGCRVITCTRLNI